MKRYPGKAAFSLVEVAIAVGIASFCLVTILALIPAGVSTNQSSIEQTVATGLMSAVIADLRGAPQPTSQSTSTATLVSPRYQIQLPRVGDAATTTNLFLKEDGTLSGTKDANADPAQFPRYRVLLNFYPPTKGLAPTRVRILITWPALSDLSVGSVPSKFAGSVETVVELNRNWLDH